MIPTEYSIMSVEELVVYALSRDSRTPMEVELAQRLVVINDMLTESLTDSPEHIDVDPRRESQI